MITGPRTRRRGSVLAVAVACALALASLPGCIIVTGTTSVVAPDAGATDFARSFAMDANRIAATALLDGGVVVYVYDRDGSEWSHSATIPVPTEAYRLRSIRLAISGDLLAVTDPTFYDNANGAGGNREGRVLVFERTGATWDQVQSMLPLGNVTFISGVWMARDTLVVAEPRDCDLPCRVGDVVAYRRTGGAFTDPVVVAPADVFLTGGTGPGRIAMATQAYHGLEGTRDASLRVIDVTGDIRTVLSVTKPNTLPMTSGYQPDGTFRRVDLAGELLAFESCCANEQRIGVARDTGSGYVAEAAIPVEGPSDWLAVLPDAVLAADSGLGAFRTYTRRDGRWQRSADIAAPDAVAATFDPQPQATQQRVALRGDERLWIMTIDAPG